MSRLISLSANFIELRQTVFLRNPITAAGTLAFRGNESVRANAVGAGVLACHGVDLVCSEVLFCAESTDRGCGERAGALRFATADGLVGLSGEGEGCQEGEEEGEGGELHFWGGFGSGCWVERLLASCWWSRRAIILFYGVVRCGDIL